MRVLEQHSTVGQGRKVVTLHVFLNLFSVLRIPFLFFALPLAMYLNSSLSMPSDFLEYFFVRIANMFIYGIFFLLASAISQVSILGKEFKYIGNFNEKNASSF